MSKGHSLIILVAVALLPFTLGRGETQEKSSPKPPPQPAGEAPSIQHVYNTQVRPLLQKYCSKCHGDEKAKANVRLDKLSFDFVKAPEEDLETWHDVLQNLQRGEMPPRSAAQPTREEHGNVVDWLNRAFIEAQKRRESTGGKIVMRRLTSYEYQNTLEDLLGLKLNYARDLLPEVPSRDGFLNNGTVLRTSSQHVKKFWAAARFAMSRAIVVGAKPKVHRFRTEQFASFTSGKKVITGADDEIYALLPDTALMTPLYSLPTEGRFRIRINLRATGPKTSMLAWFRVATSSPASPVIARTEIASSPENQTIELFGNIEEMLVLSDRGRNSPTPYLCFSNVGKIHHIKGGGESKPPSGFDRNEIKEVMDDPERAGRVSMLQINSVEFEAPYEPEWPPAHHKRILFESPNSDDEKVYAREVIAAFVERAYRRPVKEADVTPFVEHFHKNRAKFRSFAETMRETLSLVLISPNFLFLNQPRDAKLAKMPLSDFEWASRLSYFLWNSMPDEELQGLAVKGALKDPAVRKRQVERMLADARHWRFIQTFTDQWWGLSNLDKLAVNGDFHPDFDEEIKNDMRRESQLFFAEFVKNDLSLLRLVDADFTYLNNRLAGHYRIQQQGKGPDQTIGSAFQRVALRPEDKRGCGILSHGSVLVLGSDGVESHPIKRAVWVRNTIFDDPPPEPPADVPEINTEDRGKNAVTLKQRIEQHRSNQACAHCHSRVDPWGIPLEQYDALGRFRTNYAPLADVNAGKKGGKRTTPGKATPVDACSELPDGHKVDGAEGLKSYVLNEGRERYARAIVRKTLTYALGRSLEISDQPLVAELTRRFIADDYRFRSLALAIVQCEAFVTK